MAPSAPDPRRLEYDHSRFEQSSSQRRRMSHSRHRHNPLTWLTSLTQQAVRRVGSVKRRVMGKTLVVMQALLLPGILAGTSFSLAFKMEPMGWLPKASEAHAILGILLGAQAAIAALTLAVTLFVMQGVSNRRDVDDRIYMEYVRQSRVRLIFWSSVGAVALTGTVLMTETFIGDTGPIARAAAGIPNLTLMGVAAFVVNMFCAGMLFEQAIRLAKPDHWRKLRLDVNKRDVREAVRVFLGRYQRAMVANARSEADLTVMFPDPGEGSADEAVRALLDDARRAMIERRHGEFRSSLDSIRELVIYSMDEMEKEGVPWSAPGAQAEWPPLRELGRNLFLFREEIIREGNRECVLGLLEMDYWLISNGLKRGCGELFSTGLNGYRLNYQVARRLAAGEFHEMVRDEFATELNGLVFGQQPENLFPFVQEMIRHQERVLSDAMHADSPIDSARLHEGFRSAFSNIQRHWRIEWTGSPEVARLWDSLAQQYRISLMGLAGRAVILAETDRIADAGPYLEPAREAYAQLSRLADDISQALMGEHLSAFSQWTDWEMENAPMGESVTVSTDKYPQTFFTVRIMELLDGSAANLNLHGDAQRVLDWFLANSERLEHNALIRPGATVQQQRELAANALQEAVRRDELDEDYETIRRKISQDRVSAYASEIRAGALTSNYVERVFRRADALRCVSDVSDPATSDRSWFRLMGKRFFVDPADDDKAGYILMGGDQQGRAMSFDAVHLLCEVLEGAIPMTALLNSPDALLQAIDMTIEDLRPADDLAIVVAGDWGNVTVALQIGGFEGYQPQWQLTEHNQLGDLGTYRDYPILRGRQSGERRLYVVEPSTWGKFVRSRHSNGEEIWVDVEPITPARAQELLLENAGHFHQEPDEDGKLRKLQTLVEMTVVVRHGFAVADQSRARKITQPAPVAECGA